MLSGMYSGMGSGMLWVLGAGVAFLIAFAHLVAAILSGNRERHLILLLIWCAVGIGLFFIADYAGGH